MERLAVDLIKYQKNHGHDTCVLTVTEKGVLASELEENGITVIPFNKSSTMDIAVIIKMMKALKNFKADVVHTHNPVANFYGSIAAKLAGVRTVINTRHGMGNYPFDKRRENIFKVSMLFTNYVVYVCQRAKKGFLDMRLISEAKARVIYNGVNLERYESSISNDEFKKRLGIHGSPVVGLVARLEPAKNIPMFLKAAKIIQRKINKVKFLIVGDGVERQRLQALSNNLGLSECVIFLGARKDVEKILPHFDIFALSSVSEGMSLTLIEAMAAGKPIVATDVGGNPEVVEHEKTGYLVETQNTQEMADAVIKLLQDELLRSEMGSRGRIRAKEMFGLDKMAEQYELLYREQ